MTISYEWRGEFGNAELNALHAEGFGHRVLTDDWRNQLREHSLGWVCARRAGDLAGFYFGACGFAPTSAGLIALRTDAAGASGQP